MMMRLMRAARLRATPHVVAAAAFGATASSLAAASFSASCRSAESVIAQADTAFDLNEYERLHSMLTAAVVSSPKDAELNWRLTRACKKLADGKAKKEQEALLREGLSAAERSLQTDGTTCGPCHKWYAIVLSGVGEFDGTSASIKNSFLVKEHFERACALSPSDATARHLLGLWCYEVSNLSWAKRKLAATLFAAPPTSTYEEAVAHFEAAERLEPGFYPKNLLLLAQANAKLGRAAEAKAWLAKCLTAKANTPEDEETLKLAQALKL